MPFTDDMQIAPALLVSLQVSLHHEAVSLDDEEDAAE